MYALIDIDDTLSDTIKVWIRRYNAKYKDHLKVNQILDWNLAQYTVCGDKIYDFLKSKSLYNYVKPLPYALEGLEKFRTLKFNIVFVTGGTPEASVYKYKWLKDNGFWKNGDHYVQTASKYLIRGDILIDDNYENVSKFLGYSLLINAPWNLKYEYKNRMNGWKEIIENIDKFMEGTGVS